MARKANRKPARKAPPRQRRFPKAYSRNASPEHSAMDTAAAGLLVILSLIVIVALCIAADRRLAFQVVGIIILFSQLAAIVTALILWYKAFQEDFLCGLLCLVPLYLFYYIATRWDRVAALGTWHVGSVATTIAMWVCLKVVL